MKVFFGTPAYKGVVDKGYAQSLFAAGQHLLNCGIPSISAILSNAMFIEKARNVLVDSFLKTDCTHLMFVDADIAFPAEAVETLVTSGYAVSAGVCPQRDGTGYKCHPMGLPEQDGWLACSRVGTGFLCIERQVLEYMSTEAPMVDGVPHVFATKIENDQLVGEDYAWCDSYGNPIYVRTDIEFIHAGVKGQLSASRRLYDPAYRDEVRHHTA